MKKTMKTKTEKATIKKREKIKCLQSFQKQNQFKVKIEKNSGQKQQK